MERKELKEFEFEKDVGYYLKKEADEVMDALEDCIKKLEIQHNIDVLEISNLTKLNKKLKNKDYKLRIKMKENHGTDEET